MIIGHAEKPQRKGFISDPKYFHFICSGNLRTFASSVLKHTVMTPAQENKIAFVCKGTTKGKFVPVHVMKTTRAEELWVHSFLTSVLDGGERSTSHTGRFTFVKVLM
jgi:hypothetical protein